MQKIAIILAVLIFTFNFYPCTDEFQVSAEVLGTSYLTKSVPDEEEPHLEFCSPFCTCSCCSINLTIEHYNVVEIDIKEQETPNYPCEFQFTDILLPENIIKPPKLSV